jgi:hypothetical protein
MRGGRALGLALAGAALLLAGASAAQPAPAGDPAREQATRLLQRGNTQLDQGLYLEALQSFQEAYRAFPSPKLHYSIAQTQSELGRLLEALHHYELFVRDVKREEMPRQWSIATERIFKLQGTVATLQIQTNLADATVTADGAVVGRTPLAEPLRFLPGAHVVIVAREGYERQIISVTLKAGDALTRRVLLMTEDEAAAKSRVVQAAEEKRRAAQERLHRTRRIVRTSGWTALGTGLALAATGGVFGVLSKRESDKVEGAGATCSGSSCVGTRTDWTSVSGHYDRADTYRKVMIGGLAVGGALAVAGGVVLGFSYRGAERQPETPATPRLSALPLAGPQQLGVLIGGRF